MRFLFWLKRTSLVLVGAFALLATIYYIRGRADALREAAIWAALTAAVYGAGAAYHIARHRQCGLDDDAACSRFRGRQS